MTTPGAERVVPRIGPDDHASGPGQQTLGQAIVAAHEAVAAAEANRTRLIRLALDRGASTRAIADLLPVNHSTVWRWAGRGKRDPSSIVLAKEWHE